MTYAFNLLDEPWIPCVAMDGHVEELSLRDTLVQAHAWRELGGESPLVTASLYRLLLAVLHRVFGPADREAWHALWQAGRWDAVALDAYLSRWRHRFDLFGAGHPFYQDGAASKPVNPVGSLLHELSKNDTFYDHRTNEGVALSPAEAARHLVTAQAYGRWMTKGPYGQLPFGTCARGITFLARGQTLFQDLALNLIRYPTREDVVPCEASDAPCWEMDDAFQPTRSRPLGYLDHLTWLSRRIRLIPEDSAGGVIIRTAVIAPGLRMSDDLRSPMMQHRSRNKRGWKGWLAFSEDRALWRDSAPIFRLPPAEGGASSEHDTCAPAVVEWLASLVEDGHLDVSDTHRLAAYGMAGDLNQYRVHFFRSEHLPLPLALLKDQRLVTHLEESLAVAEAVRGQLWGALSALAAQVLFHKEGAALSQNERQERDRVLRAWAGERRYWAALEPAFWVLMDTLPQDVAAARRAWATSLRAAAWDALQAVIAGLPEDASSLKAAVLAGGQLGAGLTKALANYESITVERSDAA